MVGWLVGSTATEKLCDDGMSCGSIETDLNRLLRGALVSNPDSSSFEGRTKFNKEEGKSDASLRMDGLGGGLGSMVNSSHNSDF